MPTDEALLQQLPSIEVHSPLGVVGAFIFMLRDRFKPEAKLPWAWYDNKADTGILVEVQYEQNSEASDIKPGIYVDKDQTSYGQVAVGNRDQNQPAILTRRLEHFFSIAQMDMIIDCVSPQRGESAQLGDVIQQFLHMSSRIICETFTFRSLSPIVLGRTVPFTRAQNLYNTQLNFRLEYEVRWATLPAAPVLRSLLMRNSQGDVPQTFIDIYLKSLTNP